MALDFYFWMEQALAEAKKGFAEGEVPIGALLVDHKGEVLAKTHNQPISLNDPTAHAEILALRAGGTICGNYRIEGASLIVTIEPCLMCMGAVLNARISRLVFGALDPKWGAAGSLYDLTRDARLNHRIEVTSGIMEEECARVVREFFRLRREPKSTT